MQTTIEAFARAYAEATQPRWFWERVFRSPEERKLDFLAVQLFNATQALERIEARLAD